MYWFTGESCENDLQGLRSNKTGVQYFEEFKELLKGKIQYEAGNEKPNAHYLLNTDKNKAIYYTAGKGWWGAQKRVIFELQKTAEVFIVLMNDTNSNDSYYWVIKVKPGVEESGRFMFKDTRKLITNKNSIVPKKDGIPAYPNKKIDAYFEREEGPFSESDLLQRLINLFR